MDNKKFIIGYDNRDRLYFKNFDQDILYVSNETNYTGKIEEADRFSTFSEAKNEIQFECDEHVRELVFGFNGEIIGSRRCYQSYNFKDIPITDLTPEEENLIRVFRQSNLQGYHGIIYHPTMLKFTDGVASMTIHSEDEKLIDVIAQVLDWSDAKTRSEYENDGDRYIDHLRKQAYEDYKNHKEAMNSDM